MTAFQMDLVAIHSCRNLLAEGGRCRRIAYALRPRLGGCSKSQAPHLGHRTRPPTEDAASAISRDFLSWFFSMTIACSLRIAAS